MRMNVYVYSSSMITVLTNNKFMIQNHNLTRKFSLKLDNMPHWKTSNSNKMFVWNIEQRKTDAMF